MSGIDTIISAAVILIIIIVIGSKIYQHEKETIDPMIKKIKSWFIREPREDDYIGPDDDFELDFRGQLSDY